MLQFPTIGQAVALTCILAVMVGFYGLGGLWRASGAPTGARIIAGWGVATLAILVGGVATSLPLSWTFVAVFVAALAILILDWRQVVSDSESVRLVVLVLPMAIAVSAMHASQWDEFTNWLPNQRFLWEFDRFPRADLPPSLSVFPAYPFGLPLIGHFAAVLAGDFVENAGAIFNTLLIAVLASLLARQIALGFDNDREARPGWGLLALGLLAATVLNPTFVPKLVFTTYVDFTTAVVLATMVWFVWRLVEAVVSTEMPGRARNLALFAGLAFAVLVNLKQPNLLLGLFVVASGGFAVVIDARPSIATSLGLLTRLLLPPVLAFGLWRYHVTTQLTGGEFSFRPLADWIWSDTATVARQMLVVASKKGGYFGLMIVTTVVAVMSLIRRRDALGRLAIIAAATFWGWNLFLFASYLGSFDQGEGRTVASYWRYNTQLGGLAMIFAAYAAARLWRRYVSWHPGRTAAASVCALVIAAPALAQRVVDFDRAPPKGFVRAAALEVADLIPKGSIVGTMDPADNGEYMVFLRYALYRIGSVKYIGGIDWSSPHAVAQALDNGNVTHLWVRGPRPSMIEALRLPLQPSFTYLLERTSAGWRVAKEWPTTA